MNTNIQNVGVDILVNGNTCKIYKHDGRLYIEAKEGSEYEIQIKNDWYNRILATSSVDGLNVLSGESASTKDSGYVIDRNSNLRIKGFRYSDDKVAAFTFAKKSKGTSYAASKGEEALKNVGVISVACFHEYIEPLPPAPQVIYIEQKPSYIPFWPNPYWGGYPIYRDCSISCSNNTHENGSLKREYTRRISSTSFNGNNNLSVNFCSTSNCSTTVTDFVEPEPKGFDMASEFGKSKDSKVVNVEFKNGKKIGEISIYYASRESLIEMGIDLKQKVKISFPNGFPKEYCRVPSGYKE